MSTTIPHRPSKMKPQLVVFVKEARMGKVKTRLGADIGLVHSAWWYRHQCSSMMRELAHDHRWKLLVALSPETARWRGPEDYIYQGKGDLGQRMARIFRILPPGPVVIVGSDIPTLRTHHIAKAFAGLGAADAVIGPSPDGGYWCIGLKRAGKPVPHGLFVNNRWSSPHTLADTYHQLATRMKTVLIDCLQDVDRAEDLYLTD